MDSLDKIIADMEEDARQLFEKKLYIAKARVSLYLNRLKALLELNDQQQQDEH